MNDLIYLYSNKKIPNYKTAENVINLLSSKRKDQQKKAENTYMDILKKYDPDRFDIF